MSKPRRNGWYWFRGTYPLRGSIRTVDPAIFFVRAWTGTVFVEGRSELLSEFEGEWSGPLEPPRKEGEQP